MSGHWNRTGRRSGGNRPFRVVVSRSEDATPLSIQCFERRHVECRGNCEPISGEPCGCACHEESKEQEKV